MGYTNIMKQEFTIYNWSSENRCKEVLKELDLELPENEIQVTVIGDIWETVRRIFESGLNVMVYHSKNESTILFVDTRRFQQR